MFGALKYKYGISPATVVPQPPSPRLTKNQVISNIDMKTRLQDADETSTVVDERAADRQRIDRLTYPPPDFVVRNLYNYVPEILNADIRQREMFRRERTDGLIRAHNELATKANNNYGLLAMEAKNIPPEVAYNHIAKYLQPTRHQFLNAQITPDDAALRQSLEYPTDQPLTESQRRVLGMPPEFPNQP